MSTPNFSNFISNLSGSSNIDIVSSVSDQVSLTASPSTTVQVMGRYFCIGDLLIQFSSIMLSKNQSKGGYTLPFPYSYDATPYTVMLTGTNSDDNNNNSVIATLQSFDTSGCSFSISNNQGWSNFVAIGPRPSALYTS